MNERERYRPPSLRVIPEPRTDTPSETAAVPVDLRSKGVLKMIGRLPPWGQVIVFASATFGAGAGVAGAGLAKVLGVQTAAMAAADKAELKADMGAVVKAQQTADTIAASGKAEILAAVDVIRKSTMATNAKLQTLTRQLATKRTPPRAAAVPTEEPQ